VRIELETSRRSKLPGPKPIPLGQPQWVFMLPGHKPIPLGQPQWVFMK